MIISGLQKLTLLDYPEKIACTVFTGGCNFRCPFCHNGTLVKNPKEYDRIIEEDFFDFLSKRKGVLEGVCITGGEPTLQNDLPLFIKRIKDMGYLVKLDTNGYKPDVLISLVEEGLLDFVAMDIKNSKQKYAETVAVSDFDIKNIEKSAEYLLNGKIDYEFRTTVVKELHTPDDIISISKWISDAKNYYLQSFKDSGDILCGSFSAYDEKEMKSLLNLSLDYNKNTKLRGI